MEILYTLSRIFLTTIRDITPIVCLIIVFQVVLLKQPIPHLKTVLKGAIYIVSGLVLFLIGLEKALFPIGETMAKQLSDPVFLNLSSEEAGIWYHYYWIYIFAALLGFSTTIAEPALKVVAIKASEISAGSINMWGFRIVVAFGVAFALVLGTFRIISGTSIHLYIMVGYIIVFVQSFFAPRQIIALAYDSGGVTTSTVTVPLVAALGLGLSSTIPGRNPAIDGFGLIAFASLFPIISVLTYAQIMEWMFLRSKKDKS